MNSEMNEMLENTMADAKCATTSGRRKLSQLLDELRACETVVDDLEMARESVRVLEKINATVSDLMAEFKCVGYIRHHSDYLARQEG